MFSGLFGVALELILHVLQQIIVCKKVKSCYLSAYVNNAPIFYFMLWAFTISEHCI